MVSLAGFGPTGCSPSDSEKFPLIYDPAQVASKEDLEQIEEAVRRQGELYLISINIVSTKTAGATTGSDSFRPSSGKKYHLSKGGEGWKIEKVEAWSN